MGTPVRPITNQVPVLIGAPEQHAIGATWGGPAGPDYLGNQETQGLSLWGRLGYHAQSMFGGTLQLAGDGVVRAVDPSRVLTPEQLHLIYVRTPDVRSSIDGIVRRVATWDWDIVPTMDPSDDEHEAAIEECARIREWLKKPTADGDTWQEVMTAFLTDLLKFDAGVLELVPGTKNTIEEIPALKGSDVHPMIDDTGRLVKYVQEPRVGIRAAPAMIELPVEQVLYMRLFPNTENPEGIPLLESLVYEVIGILRGFEGIAKSLDVNEIPAGLLVLVGLAKEAGAQAKAEYQQKKGRDHEMRVITSEKPAGAGGVDAKWIQFKKDPRELQVLEIAREISRAIWRVFGVMPVEQGATEGMPRATAQVQLDAGNSHLIGPILELLQAKIDSQVVQRNVRPEWAGKVAFQFIVKAKLTPAQALERARELVAYVDAGILTRNEVRRLHPEGPFSPIAGGDVPTVRVPGGAVIPLVQALVQDEGDDPDEAGEDEELDAVEDESGVDADAVSGDDKAADKDEKKEKKKTKKTKGVLSVYDIKLQPWAHAARRQPSPRRATGRAGLTVLSGPVEPSPAPVSLGRLGHRGSIQRSILDDSPPSGWVSGRFKGHRTLDLPGLWGEISGYTRAVLPLWEEARAQAVSVLAREYVQSGFDAERRGRVMDELSQELDRLAARWMLAVSPIYERVALAARARGGSFTAYASDPERTRQVAQLYRDQAMGYLTAPQGPLAEVRERAGQLLVAISDQRGRTPPDRRGRGERLTSDAAPAAVLSAMAALWDGVRHRITNWAGKLYELASRVLADELQQGAHTGQALGIADGDGGGGAVDWWVEWSNLGDGRDCPDCLDLGGQGYIRLRDLRTQPGGDTQCGAQCRCVLIYWTRAEIDSGRAQLEGDGGGDELG